MSTKDIQENVAMTITTSKQQNEDGPESREENKIDSLSVPRNKPLRNRHWAWLQYIGDINTAQQSFQTYFELWVESEISLKEYEKYCNDPANYTPDPIPTVHIPNAIQVDIASAVFDNGRNWYIRYHKPFGSYVVRKGYKINAKLFQDLELKNFPFDVQHLEIFIHLRYDTLNEPNWPYNTNDPSTENVFNVHSESLDFIGWHFVGLEYGLSTNKTWQDHIRLRVKLQRTWRYYFYRVIVVMGIISLVTPFCFLFGDPLDSVGDRFSYSSTMLLTAVAYMLITVSFIPTLNYLTLLDQYIYFTFFYILFIALEILAETVVLNKVDVDMDPIDIDYVLLGCDILIWIVVHIVFASVAGAVYKKELAKCDMTKEGIKGEKDDRIRLSNQDYEFKNEYKNLNVYRKSDVAS